MIDQNQIVCFAFSMTDRHNDNPYKIYNNTGDKGGKLTCTCPSFFLKNYRPKPNSCKHIEVFKNLLLMGFKDNHFFRLTDFGKKVYGLESQ